MKIRSFLFDTTAISTAAIFTAVTTADLYTSPVIVETPENGQHRSNPIVALPTQSEPQHNEEPVPSPLSAVALISPPSVTLSVGAALSVFISPKISG